MWVGRLARRPFTKMVEVVGASAFAAGKLEWQPIGGGKSGSMILKVSLNGAPDGWNFGEVTNGRGMTVVFAKEDAAKFVWCFSCPAEHPMAKALDALTPVNKAYAKAHRKDTDAVVGGEDWYRNFILPLQPSKKTNDKEFIISCTRWKKNAWDDKPNVVPFAVYNKDGKKLSPEDITRGSIVRAAFYPPRATIKAAEMRINLDPAVFIVDEIKAEMPGATEDDLYAAVFAAGAFGDGVAAGPQAGAVLSSKKKRSVREEEEPRKKARAADEEEDQEEDSNDDDD